MGTDTFFGSARTLYLNKSATDLSEDGNTASGQDHIGAQNGYSFFQDIGVELQAAKAAGALSCLFAEDLIPASSMNGKGQVSQFLDTIEYEIFKITEMARRWITENGLSPYKLALTADTSPSQVHRIMEPGWSPSLKLARKIASSLPEDWVSAFERDCNTCLPRLFYLQASSVIQSGPINEVVQAVNTKGTGAALHDLLSNGFGCRHFRFQSRSEINVQTARQASYGVTEAEYVPPAPKMVWQTGKGKPELPHSAFAIHRVPLRAGENMALCTVHIAEFDGHNWAQQFWKIEENRLITDPRQLDILNAYLTEFTAD